MIIHWNIRTRNAFCVGNLAISMYKNLQYLSHKLWSRLCYACQGLTAALSYYRNGKESQYSQCKNKSQLSTKCCDEHLPL
uniref:Uncharacterized protein n=1 Tax=Pararge aegeria TaxID=116150 RepID=S4PYK3_9NEOP